MGRVKLTFSSRFLLASLHMQSLKDKVSIRKFKEALAQLPKGSGSAASKIAYDETMNRIRGQEKGFRDLAIATLSWISLAIIPLTLRELQCALSVEPGDTAMDEANFVDEETLSSVCAGLMVVNHESQIVRLAHYTTQEYFDTQKDVLFPDGEKLLATTCLTYLSFDVFSDWQLNTPYRCNRAPTSRAVRNGGVRISHCYPLFDYAACSWHKHAHSSQDPTLQGLIIEYLKRTRNLAALLCGSLHKSDWDIDSALPLEEPLFPQCIHGLSIAVRYGFTDAVKALLHSEGSSAEDGGRIKAQALGLAAFYGQSSALRILLDDNTIAPAAVSHALSFLYMRGKALPGFYEVAEMLLNHGADANTALDDIPLIHLASRRNDVQSVSLLLSHGADVALRDWKCRTALHEAAEEGHSGDLVKVLLQRGLDINGRDSDGETALLTAIWNLGHRKPSERNHERVITQLLGLGASVHQSDSCGWTALHWATKSGAPKIACQLLEAGADVHARNDDGETAADRLDKWDWNSIAEEERVEYKEILEKYSFYQRRLEKSRTELWR